MIMDDSSPAPCPSGPGMGDGFRGIAVAVPEGSRYRMRWIRTTRKTIGIIRTAMSAGLEAVVVNGLS